MRTAPFRSSFFVLCMLLSCAPADNPNELPGAQPNSNSQGPARQAEWRNGTRLKRIMYVTTGADGTRVEFAPDVRFRDTTLNTDCVAKTTADGGVFCLPIGARALSVVYADSSCRTPIDAIQGSVLPAPPDPSCGGVSTEWLYQEAPGACGRTEPTTYYRYSTRDIFQPLSVAYSLVGPGGTTCVATPQKYLSVDLSAAQRFMPGDFVGMTVKAEGMP